MATDIRTTITHYTDPSSQLLPAKLPVHTPVLLETLANTVIARGMFEAITHYVFTSLSKHLGPSFTESINAPDRWIQYFYSHLITSVPMTVGQLVHSVILFDRAIEYDKMCRLSSTQASPFVTEYTYGTLLLCSVIVALKMDEDSCHSNRYFSCLYKVPLKDINSSETFFFQALSYSASVNPDKLQEYISLLNKS